VILASLLTKIEEHADELCALLATERGGPIAQARWEIDLLTHAFGPVLRQMEVYEKEKDRRPIEQITKRFVPTDGGGVISRWNFPVILSFGKVLPALLTGDTIVLRPSPLLPLTVLRISELIRELLPPGVFNVVTGGQDLWPWLTSHSGIYLINFTTSTDLGEGSSKSAAPTLRPATLDLAEKGFKAVADVDPDVIDRVESLYPEYRPRLTIKQLADYRLQVARRGHAQELQQIISQTSDLRDGVIDLTKKIPEIGAGQDREIAKRLSNFKSSAFRSSSPC
jgi:acyl-CoA reductase-like NAD-dependent aldehyde dehydrogenase